MRRGQGPGHRKSWGKLDDLSKGELRGGGVTGKKAFYWGQGPLGVNKKKNQLQRRERVCVGVNLQRGGPVG